MHPFPGYCNFMYEISYSTARGLRTRAKAKWLYAWWWQSAHLAFSSISNCLRRPWCLLTFFVVLSGVALKRNCGWFCSYIPEWLRTHTRTERDEASHSPCCLRVKYRRHSRAVYLPSFLSILSWGMTSACCMRALTEDAGGALLRTFSCHICPLAPF